MSILDIKLYPDTILKQVCYEVKSVDEAIKDLIDNMVSTMFNASGAGLAAPQVGVSLRIIVLSDFENNSSGVISLVNPQILYCEGQTFEEEGCLSLPETFVKVKRFEKIRVKGLDKFGEDVAFEAIGLTSRIIQHEVDHLDGVVFLDRLGPVKREILKRRYKNRMEK